jgi:large subunit ribosomal protein L29
VKVKEIRAMGAEEISKRLSSLREELFRLRMQHGTHQLESTATLGATRRHIARLMTVLREREIGGHGIQR